MLSACADSVCVEWWSVDREVARKARERIEIPLFGTGTRQGPTLASDTRIEIRFAFPPKTKRNTKTTIEDDSADAYVYRASAAGLTSLLRAGRGNSP